jgi:hypothetical protein
MDLKSLFSNFFTLDIRQVDWRRTTILILIVLVVFLWLSARLMSEVRDLTTTEFRRVPQIREVTRIRTVTVPGPKKIVILDKAEVVKKVDGVPAEIAASTDKQIPATAAIPESRNGVDVISVIDTKTGESQIIAKERPAPLFQLRRDAALGVRYGFNYKGEQTGTVYGRYDFLRVKNVWLSVHGEVSVPGDARAQIGAEYRW